MAEPNPQSNGADTEQPSDLRSIAEAAYDGLVNGDAEVAEDAPAPSGPPRDEHGRFIARSPSEGEAEDEGPPSPEEGSQETEEHPAPETGQAAQAPSNWSAEDRANFEKLPKEGQDFLLRRHSEMESDYQKRVQAAAMSNQFVQAVAPVFNDQEIALSIQTSGRTPVEAVYQWASFHKRAINADPAVRTQLLFELADRMQLDPAAVFRQQQQAQPITFTQEELANPAIRKFADQFGRLNAQLQANQQYLSQFHAQQQQAVTAQRRAEIDAFADARDASGKPLHPHFDAVLPIVEAIYRDSPGKSLDQCYKEAVEPLLGPIQAQAQASVEQRQNLARAQTAVRGNLRGTTAPVARPSSPSGPRDLRTAIAEAAEEIGFAG